MSSALMKMLGIDKAMEGIDFEAVGQSFVKAAEAQEKNAETLSLILNKLDRIEKHLGLKADSAQVADVIDLRREA